MCDRIIMPDGRKITHIDDPKYYPCLCSELQDDILIWIIQNLSKSTTPLKINDVLRIERDPFGYLVTIGKTDK